MLGIKSSVIILGWVAFSVSVGAVEYKRERYDIIVDRSPFGEEVVIDQTAQKDAKAEADALATVRRMERNIRLCYLLEMENGEIRAGFENKVAKAGDPKSFMLMLNDNVNGMKLSKVDLANSRATLLMGGESVTFELKKMAQSGSSASKASSIPRRRFGGGFRKQAPANPTPPSLESDLSPEEQALQRKAVRARLENYQMDVIRQGMPPLPIPLTQEMDDQLVSEGVLPPDPE